MRAVVGPWYGRQVDEVFEVGGSIEKPVEHKVLMTTMIMMTVVMMMVRSHVIVQVMFHMSLPELIMTWPTCVGLAATLHGISALSPTLRP